MNSQLIRVTQRVMRNLRTQAVGQPVKLEVKQGVIVGEQRLLPNGSLFNSFQGIPYAVPPLRDLRFKSPLPLTSFETDELDCRSERSVAHQKDPFSQEIIGSENCLFLNVYAPQKKTEKPLPVMVFIHGGGYFFGSGSSEFHYPLSLMEEDVIVITMNYRLGAFGFLCFPEEQVWGNAGLKDQRLALEWIQQNISKFNGDPNNVTLFGESAGASSVHLHTYAKHANKLFHKAIMQSGTGNCEWVFQTDPVYKTKRFAELLGCSSTNSKEIMEFLRSDNVDEMNVLNNTLGVLTADERRRNLPLTFKPVVEDPASPDSFVDTPILEACQQKNRIGSMPTMMGYNSAESLAMLINAIKKLQVIDRDLERYVPKDLQLDGNDIALNEIAVKMRQFYLNGQEVGMKTLNEFTEMLSDYHFTIDMQKAAKMHVENQEKAPLYFYHFDYIGGRNLYKKIFQFEKLKGACHGDEMFYLFQMVDEVASAKNVDALLTKRISKLWANFAKSGNPTPNGVELPIIDCVWQPVEKPIDPKQFNLDVYTIDRECKMLRNPEKERMEFWRDIYEKYNAVDDSRLKAKL